MDMYVEKIYFHIFLSISDANRLLRSLYLATDRLSRQQGNNNLSNTAFFKLGITILSFGRR